MNKHRFYWIKFIFCVIGTIGAVTIGIFSIGINIIEFLILLAGMIICIVYIFVGDP